MLGDHRLKRALRGQLAFGIAEQGGWLSVLLYAFGRGGVAEAGLVSAVLLLPAAALAPFIAAAADWFPRHRVLTAG